MTVFLAADHAGYALKESLKPVLDELGYDWEDLGAHSYEKEDDYPDFVIPAAERVAERPEEHVGIVIGGSGQGEAMAANAVPGVRAAVFYGPRTPSDAVDAEGHESDDAYEIVRLERRHNRANVLSLGARFHSEEEAKRAVRVFLDTDWGDAERHERRVEKIKRFEESL